MARLERYPFMQVTDLKRGLVAAWRDRTVWLETRATYLNLRVSAAYAVANNTVHTVLWDSILSESADFSYDDTTGLATCINPGIFHADCMAGFTANATGRRLMQIKKNSNVIVQDEIVPSSGLVLFLGCGRSVEMVEGDTLQVDVFQTSGASLNLFYNASNPKNTFTIARSSI
jgi:hypothetical protein